MDRFPRRDLFYDFGWIYSEQQRDGSSSGHDYKINENLDKTKSFSTSERIRLPSHDSPQ